MFHMREVKIGESICVLVLLFSGLVTCSGVFGSPLTDDVATLDTLSENIPSDYRIPIKFITKDVGGACWLHLNLYPVEGSLKKLAIKFGNQSTNKANITIFITMLQDFRFTLNSDDLEDRMQAFKCHYRREKWPTRRFFTHVKSVLTVAGSTFGDIPPCTPPPCQTLAAPPFTPGQSRQQNGMNSAVHGLLALLIIPSVAILVLTIQMALGRRSHCGARMREVEPHEGAEESRNELHGGAAQEDPASSSASEQDRAWLDSLGCADTEV
ncbi:kit ligand b [Danio aesculapii]|uniref:kit ligand b n=1 Tax=Danio aesculapii TaxID=1142201 RepID=UPI0024BF5502|nr:kit ligand b [Danio aesculapii]